MKIVYYKLNEDKTVTKLEKDEYYQNYTRHTEKTRVGLDVISNQKVSTIFLHFDHNWSEEGDPILFETMIFGGQYDRNMWRYSTWDEALEGHKRVVNCLKENKNPNKIE